MDNNNNDSASISMDILKCLIEVFISPKEPLRNLSITIINYFKEKNIRIKNIKLSDQQLSFSVDDEFKQIILDEFSDEESEINPYYQRFKSHQLEIEEDNNVLTVNFSRQGIIEIKTSSQDSWDEVLNFYVLCEPTCFLKSKPKIKNQNRVPMNCLKNKIYMYSTLS